MALPPKWYQFLVAIFASLGSVLYGYDLGVIAGAVASQNFVDTFDPTKAEIGAVVSVFTGGAFVGAGLAGPIGDYLGRKVTILIGSLIFILGGGLQTGAQALSYLYAGRLIAGVGVGFLVMIIPLYQAELAHPSIRGRVTALQQFMLGIGALVAAWVSYATYTYIPDSSSNQWRISLGIQIIPAGFLAITLCLVLDIQVSFLSAGPGSLTVTHELFLYTEDRIKKSSPVNPRICLDQVKIGSRQGLSIRTSVSLIRRPFRPAANLSTSISQVIPKFSKRSPCGGATVFPTYWYILVNLQFVMSETALHTTVLCISKGQ